MYCCVIWLYHKIFEFWVAVRNNIRPENLIPDECSIGIKANTWVWQTVTLICLYIFTTKTPKQFRENPNKIFVMRIVSLETIYRDVLNVQALGQEAIELS